MAKIDALRKLLREEIRKVLKEELSTIISESKKNTSYSETFKSKKTTDVPRTLNSQPTRPVPPVITGNKMLNSILSETAMSMRQTDVIHFSSHDVDGFALMQRANEESVGVGSIDSMINSSMPSGVHEMVQINQVPDFSELMNKMMDKGVM